MGQFQRNPLHILLLSTTNHTFILTWFCELWFASDPTARPRTRCSSRSFIASLASQMYPWLFETLTVMGVSVVTTGRGIDIFSFSFSKFFFPSFFIVLPLDLLETMAAPIPGDVIRVLCISSDDPQSQRRAAITVRASAACTHLMA